MLSVTLRCLNIRTAPPPPPTPQCFMGLTLRVWQLSVSIKVGTYYKHIFVSFVDVCGTLVCRLSTGCFSVPVGALGF